MKDLYQIYLNHPVICTDSRKIIPGSIFFALKGPLFNGNAFAEKALALGSSYAVIDEKQFQKDEKYILVDDVLNALQDLANHHRRQLKIPFLAITGSNGKTTTKELIRSILSKKYKTHATTGNLNNHIGVPLTILSINRETEFAVIEMGANHLHEIENLCKIAEPEYGLITNVGKAHLEGFGSFEGVKIGKGELYEWIAKKGKAIFQNADNSHLISMSDKYNELEKISYGTKQGLHCSGTLVKEQPFDNAQGKPFLTVQWNSNKVESVTESNLVGAYNFENILSAICVGNYFGVSSEKINEAIKSYSPDNSRSQLVKKDGNTIVLDAYNANPSSMEAALKNFENISAPRKVVFIGEMAELGDESTSEHKRIAEILQHGKYDEIFLVGKNFDAFSKQFKCFYFEDSEKTAAWIKNHPVRNSLILIKGSRATKMEKVFEAL